jgi:hypothetical protein
MKNGILHFTFGKKGWRLGFEKEKAGLIEDGGPDFWIDNQNRGRITNADANYVKQLRLVRFADATVEKCEASVGADGRPVIKREYRLGGFAKSMTVTETFELVPGMPILICRVRWQNDGDVPSPSSTSTVWPPSIATERPSVPKRVADCRGGSGAKGPTCVEKRDVERCNAILPIFRLGCIDNSAAMPLQRRSSARNESCLAGRLLVCFFLRPWSDPRSAISGEPSLNRTERGVTSCGACVALQSICC